MQSSPPEDIAHLKNDPRPAEATLKRASWYYPICILALTCISFAWPLGRLVHFALYSELYSYILLIPFIAGYLARRRRHDLPQSFSAAPIPASITALGAIALMTSSWLLAATASPIDILALQTLSFVLAIWSIAFATLGVASVRILAIPLGLLLFIVPFPSALEHITVSFLQHGSVPFAHGLFILTGTSVMVDGLIIWLPGLTLQVAPECSGIHSTIVLFITSIVAAELFLKTTWKKIVFVLAVIPIALLRNGFRVFVLGDIAVYHDPTVLNSPLHRQGGPIFFALSLIPFFVLLYMLRRGDQRQPQLPTASTP